MKCVLARLGMWLLVSGCAREGAPPVFAPVLTPTQSDVARHADAATGPAIQSAKKSDIPKPVVPPEREQPLAWFATPLGYKPFELVSISGREALGATYRFDVRIKTQTPMRGEDLLGTLATAAARTPNGTMYVSGFIYEAVVLDEGRTVDLTLVPWTHLLSKVAGSAIYAEEDVPGVLQHMMGDHPFASYRMDLRETYPRRASFVQYRETDLNFLSRLVEHVGIVTFFEHRADSHDIVFVDRQAGFGDNATAVTGAMLEGTKVTSVLTSTRFVLRTPTLEPTSVVSEVASSPMHPWPVGELEMYDFEGSSRPGADVAFYARLRAEEQWSAVHTLGATLKDTPLHPGQVLSISDSSAETDGRFLVKSTSVSVRVGAERNAVTISFEAVPQTSMFRTSRRTPWPTIQGAQIARVVEVAERRAKVHFPWARGGRDIWIPVAAPASSATPGTDVVVDFLEGDVDRPLATSVVAH